MKKVSKKLIVLITAIGLIAAPASSLEAAYNKKNRNYTEKNGNRHNNHDGQGARIGGFLLGAGAGGGIAAGIGRARWAALGAPLGGFAGYFLVRAIQNGNKNRTHTSNVKKNDRGQNRLNNR